MPFKCIRLSQNYITTKILRLHSWIKILLKMQIHFFVVFLECPLTYDHT